MLPATLTAFPTRISLLVSFNAARVYLEFTCIGGAENPASPSPRADSYGAAESTLMTESPAPIAACLTSLEFVTRQKLTTRKCLSVISLLDKHSNAAGT